MKLTSAIVKRWIRHYESNEYQEVAEITAKKCFDFYEVHRQQVLVLLLVYESHPLKRLRTDGRTNCLTPLMHIYVCGVLVQFYLLRVQMHTHTVLATECLWNV